MKSSYRLPVLVSLLLLAALACNLGSAAQAPTPMAVTLVVKTAAPTSTSIPPTATHAPSATVPPAPASTDTQPAPTQAPTEAPPTVAPTEAPTVAPTEAPTAQPTTAGRMVTFENVLFVSPNGLSQSEHGQIMPAETNGAPWDITVQYVKFSFSGYPLSGTFHEPVIYVYPTQGFDVAADTIANLKDLLSLRPADANNMPFLPPFNAGQVFHAQVKYLDFGSGGGVRYLTQYGQAIWPVNNHDMFYTYQGLTSDGQYYVSAIMPIANSSLPATGDGVDLQQLTNTYDTYIAGIRTQLDAQPDASFTPALSLLDQLMQTVKVR